MLEGPVHSKAPSVVTANQLSDLAGVARYQVPAVGTHIAQAVHLPGRIPGQDHRLIQEIRKQYKGVRIWGILQETVIPNPLPGAVKDLILQGFEYPGVRVKRGRKGGGFPDIRIDIIRMCQAGINLYF
jgi:hypothetical protein